MSVSVRLKDERRSTTTRTAALDILECGIEAIDPQKAIREAVAVSGEAVTILGREYFGPVYLFGVGKCSHSAASELENILGERVKGGVVIDIVPGALSRTTYFMGDHPMPSEKNVKAARELLSLAKKVPEDALAIVIVSGGGSTLLCDPKEPMTCTSEAVLLKELFKKGATIQEINILRKHLSEIRGGGLATVLNSRVEALVISDVPGNSLESIASGPTVLDRTTIEDARAILQKYELSDAVPSVALMETPKEEALFQGVHTSLLLSNKDALRAMSDRARTLGFSSRIMSDTMIGEARVVGEDIVARLHKEPPKSVLLWGGETTVTINGSGKGGRNRELAMGALLDLREGELVGAIASDGIDNGSAAGGISDILTARYASEIGFDSEEYLLRNDSESFFGRIGDALITGPTGTNVSDLIIAIKE